MTEPLRRLYRTFAILALTLLFAGCSRTPSWFAGDFEFDAAEALKPLVEPTRAAGKPESKAGDGLKRLVTLFAPLALGQKYDGSRIRITRNEIIQTRNGSGTVVKFEVYEVPNNDTVVIKTSDNKIETWIRTKNGIGQKATGDIDLIVPFKRKKS